MEYVTLGKSDLKVSRICMGCMGFGNAQTGQHSWTVDEEASKSIIKRGLEQDAYARLKYDASADKDAKVIARVCEIADARKVSMTEVSLAWLLTKAASPVVGATKISHVEGAVSAVDLKLTDDDIKVLEEFYEPHFLSGVMAQNTPAARTTEQVWIKNGKYAK